MTIAESDLDLLQISFQNRAPMHFIASSILKTAPFFKHWKLLVGFQRSSSKLPSMLKRSSIQVKREMAGEITFSPVSDRDPVPKFLIWGMGRLEITGMKVFVDYIKIIKHEQFNKIMKLVLKVRSLSEKPEGQLVNFWGWDPIVTHQSHEKKTQILLSIILVVYKGSLQWFLIIPI